MREIAGTRTKLRKADGPRALTEHLQTPEQRCTATAVRVITELMRVVGTGVVLPVDGGSSAGK